MDDLEKNAWCRGIDAVVRGESQRYRTIRLGTTPKILKMMGLAPADLVMSAAKIAKVRRKHPEVQLDTWYRLHALLSDPYAIFPSKQELGTIIVNIAVLDVDRNPTIVAIMPSEDGKSNVIKSIYGKQKNPYQTGFQWIEQQIANAIRDNQVHYHKNGSADSKPKPGSAEAIPWSPDLISVDRSTEPRRKILTLSEKTTKI